LRLVLVLALVALPCWGQNYPSKPIRLVVPFAPGGSSTIVARSVAIEMEKALGQNIVIENKGGGGGNPAMLDVARADPDGYTLLITHIGSLALNPYLYSNLPFDVNRDFVHVSLLAKVPNIFVVHESVPAKDAREFVALVRKEPGKYYYGSAGNGSAGHLAMEYFKLVAGIELQHVPYKGTVLALNDVLESGRLRRGDLVLMAEDFAEASIPQNDFFDARAGQAQAWSAAIERIRGRLGEDKVWMPQAMEDHRPERAMRRAAALPAKQIPAFSGPLRPSLLYAEPWIMPPPAIPAGTAFERIESGWWDGDDQRRDYTILDINGGRAWVYREVESDHWFLHGWFS